ncbi:IMP dehydrogenase [Methanococcus voltae]|uniref:Inosine-5'-monophosphate dehydrogenase n=1 Tax=Methanococcus voltae (strain ATCC BAA-1334 / A3) TaxID=456320 RepID=D7DV30_METV3|nr:IMP dehydrogenase [Methanococcus voltae]MCS3900795.1 IMP dehydrogenase [Methanococcus voltae]
MFSDKIYNAKKAYTFDDVLLIPNKSYVEPKNTSLSTNLSGVELNVPVISAAMDTVSEKEMAITLARRGGMAVIHRNMTIEEQVKQVSAVKRAENLVVRDVVTVSPELTVSEVEMIMYENEISGLPVVDKNKTLLGIITTRDLKFVPDMNLKVKDVMTKDVLHAHEDTPYEDILNRLYENKIERMPILERETRVLMGMVTLRDILKRRKYPEAVRDEEGNLLVAAACGPNDFERAKALIEAKVDVIAIDCAHAHNMNVVENVRKFKELLTGTKVKLFVGNVATKEAAEDLIKAGADAIKVGIGPGSICTTRVVAGVGVPQLTAVAEVADVAKKYGIPVIADGGIKYSGDVAKAIAAGASAVMLGSLLAGTDEAPGQLITINGRKYKQYRGMGSLGAMCGSSGNVADRYFQKSDGAHMKHTKLVPEGIEGAVPYKGSVSDIIFQIAGGLRSSMGYCGSENIEEMHEKARFVIITQSGQKESHPHDVLITNEAPNYPLNSK